MFYRYSFSYTISKYHIIEFRLKRYSSSFHVYPYLSHTFALSDQAVDNASSAVNKYLIINVVGMTNLW